MEAKDGVENQVDSLSTQLSVMSVIDVENKGCQTVDVAEIDTKPMDVVGAEAVNQCDGVTHKTVSECSTASKEDTVKGNASDFGDYYKLENSAKGNPTFAKINSVKMAPEITNPKVCNPKVSSTDVDAGMDTQKECKKSDALEVPPSWVVEKILQEAEFYFSDWNVLKNNFLLKHIRRNKEGYISIKLLASYRKIKAVAKDWRVVAFCLEGSKLLELNSEKTKIRRIEPIPKLEDTTLGKTVIAYNLPLSYRLNVPSCKEDLKAMFSKFGAVLSADIMTPKSQTYNIYHKRCRLHHHEISSYTFGVVEFEKYEDALKAIKDVDSNLPKENKMKVVPLLPQVYSAKPRNSRFNSFASNNGRGRGRFIPRTTLRKSQFRSGYQGDYDYHGRFMSDAFYRGQFWRQNPMKSQSCNEIRGKMPMDNMLAKLDGGRNRNVPQRQLKSSSNINY